jgi:hypothetical protein
MERAGSTLLAAVSFLRVFAMSDLLCCLHANASEVIKENPPSLGGTSLQALFSLSL